MILSQLPLLLVRSASVPFHDLKLAVVLLCLQRRTRVPVVESDPHRDELAAFAEHMSKTFADDEDLAYLIPIDPCSNALCFKLQVSLLNASSAAFDTRSLCQFSQQTDPSVC